ncbi:hypothetical protein D3C71_1496420 [compost metagenome]
MHRQFFALRLAEHHRGIEVFRSEIQPVRYRSGQLNMHFRSLVLKPDNTRQHPAHGTGWALDPQGPWLRPDSAQRLIQLSQGLLHRGQQHGSLRCQRQATRASAKQRITQILFQPQYLPADRALRQVQALGGVSEIKALGHHQKGFQYVERRQ